LVGFAKPEEAWLPSPQTGNWHAAQSAKAEPARKAFVCGASLRQDRPRMRPRRLILALALATLATPGLWWRGTPSWPRNNGVRDLHLTVLAARPPSSWPAGLRLVRAWELTSGSNRFGGYSALLAGNDGTLTAISDIATSLRFRRPDLAGPTMPQFENLGRRKLKPGEHFESDIESAAWDPRTGARWFGYEGVNKIKRFDRGTVASVDIQPPAMRDWSENGGAESMVRLPDGRFIVLEEDPPWLSTGARSGLLFPADPVTGVVPLQFKFRPPIGYHPSDAAVMPDGRVVILLRAIDPPFPPFFRGMLLVADPADIAAGREWSWQKLADLEEPLPIDNYEGLAIVPDSTGVTLWLISDDNLSRLQRNLLLELHWQIRSP
jgi:hypothetical protein